ncbi:MAG: hypothetical protein R2867_34160 [Caldilineaceae bacterium]
MQLRINLITGQLIDVGFLGALKAVMAHLGFDCGSTRLPNAMLPQEKWQPLFDQITQSGFNELAEM